MPMISSMSYKVQTIAVFERQAKRLIRKYPSLKLELTHLIQSLKSNPLQGTAIGQNCYKIRLAKKSKNKGKSSGSRVITHFYIAHSTVFLLAIYDKSEKSTISDKELDYLVSFID